MPFFKIRERHFQLDGLFITDVTQKTGHPERNGSIIAMLWPVSRPRHLSVKHF